MKRLTTQEKDRKGTLRPSRETPVSLQPLEEIPDAPEHLGKVAATAYLDICELLRSARRLTRCDLFAVEATANAYADWRVAADHITHNGPTVPFGRSERASPYVALRNEADRRLRGWLQSLGLTPADRDKIVALAPVEDDDEWGDLLQ